MFTKMNVVLCVVLIFAFIGHAAKNNRFIVKWDRMIIHNLSPEIVNISGGCKYLNRTTKALNLDAMFNDQINETNIVHMLANKWINNNWVRYSAIQFTENMKDVLDIKWFDLQSLFLNHSVPQIVWPFQRTLYKIRNFVMNADNFPQYIPTGYYKAEASFFTSKKRDHKVAQLDWYLHLVPLNNFKKNRK